jgi:hypothetical protein
MMLCLTLLLALAAGSPQAQQPRIGEIDFFGTDGIDVEKVRSVLPVRKGEVVAENQNSGVRDRINQAIEREVGHPPTDVALICCDDQASLMIYIGLGGENTAIVPVLPTPNGSTCLPRPAVALYDATMAALIPAIQKGHSGENDSGGYSLSDDTAVRAKQIAMRKYAVTHEERLEQALQACGIPEHRRAAAELLGYGLRSGRQIGALVRASHDPDGLVRNNAVRALWVLATANPQTASEIPADGFVEMLNSGVWDDRNKAGLLLMALSRSRPLQLLERLRTQALPSLIEMARWQDSSHASAYRVLLGRIAGFDEARIEELIRSGRVGEIVAAAENESSTRKVAR